MSRTTALLLGVAAFTVISTIAQAADGCGRGWFNNGLGCVPIDEPGYLRPQYPGDYYGPQYLSDYYGPPVWIPPDLPPNPAYKTWNNCPLNFAVQNGLCKPYSGRKGQQSSRTQR